MLLDVKKILHVPGKSIPFRFSLDLSQEDQRCRQPVQVAGEARNIAGMLTLDFEASAPLDAVCDRCMKAFPLTKTAAGHFLLAEEICDEENDEIILLENGAFDLGELARPVFLLALDTKTLCSEDCKGLCPRCGKDLNEGPCTCREEPDPRWAVLAQLLEEESGS